MGSCTKERRRWGSWRRAGVFDEAMQQGRLLRLVHVIQRCQLSNFAREATSERGLPRIPVGQSGDEQSR